jgi:hypothetical protein
MRLDGSQQVFPETDANCVPNRAAGRSRMVSGVRSRHVSGFLVDVALAGAERSSPGRFNFRADEIVPRPWLDMSMVSMMPEVE